jgi:hypothetical protein
MLKKRFQKWGIERKQNETDMRFAIQTALHRKAQGKNTVFWIRDRKVTVEDVEKYYKGKGVFDLNALANATTAVPTSHIDCRTPSPSPEEKSPFRSESSGDARIQDLHEDSELRNIRGTIVTLPDLHQVDQLLSSASLHQLERFIYLNRSHYAIIFDNPQRRSNEMFKLDSLKRFHAGMRKGQNLLRRGTPAAAFEHFDSAFGQIHNILKHQSFLFLPYLYHTSMLLAESISQTIDVLSRLLDFISQMALSCHFLQVRPVIHTLKWAMSLPPEDRIEYLRRAYRSIIEYLRVRFAIDSVAEAHLDPDIMSLANLNTATRHDPHYLKRISTTLGQLMGHVELGE